MRILVACEFSRTVRDEFSARGHDAVSCDLLPSERPGAHIQGDVLDHLDSGWDVMIGHPPCTYLAASGMHWNGRVEGRQEKTEAALEFVRALMDAPIRRICIENPVSIISTRIRKPDQIVHPWMFGHDASKQTCLWLKGLPALVPTKSVAPRLVCCGVTLETDDIYGCKKCLGERKALRRWANQTDSGQNNLGPSASRWKDRSRTYTGIAAAMADQWRLI